MEFYLVGAFTILMLLLSSIRFVKEHDRLVIFRMGHAVGVRGPGPCFVFPFLEHAEKVDVRIGSISVPVQDIVTSDSVPAKVAAICLFHISDPKKYVTKVADPQQTTHQLAESALKQVIAEHDLKFLVNNRNAIHHKLHSALNKQTRSWGISVKTVELTEFQIGNTSPHSVREFVTVLDSLGKFCIDEGKFDQAEQLLKVSLDLQENNRQPDKKLLAASLEQYAELLRQTQRTGEADQIQYRALELKEQS